MSLESNVVRVQINDGSNAGNLVLLVPTECTVQDLKALLFKYHKVPIEVQTWFRDEKQSLGLLKDDSIIEKHISLCLYVQPMALCKENVRRSDFEKWHEEITNVEALPFRVKDTSMDNVQPKTQVLRHTPRAAVNQGARKQPQEVTYRREVLIVSDYCHLCGETPAVFCFTCDEKQSFYCKDCSGIIHSDEATQAHDVVSVDQVNQPKLSEPTHREHAGASKTTDRKKKAPQGWECTACTYLNLPLRPGCLQCTTERPAAYKVPEGYVPTAEEREILEVQQRAEKAMKLAKKAEKEEREKNRIKLLQTDLSGAVKSEEEFECLICSDTVGPGNGVRLRECLHQFCRDCLRGTIEASAEPEVKCPFTGDGYTCNEPLQEREIKEIAPGFHEKLLEKSVRTAEAQMANSYHCKTIDCRGWCIYEDEVNFFTCYICQHKNCLTCKAIHENMDCKQYQDDLKLRAQNDLNARATQEAIENMIKNGEAMYCPGCKVIVQKKEGCDWLQCSVCKIEICWARRMTRWGPKGRGDASGGCGCNLARGQRCHPNCGNCH